mmetsp:Transcript_26428/g.31182  ORF Transcript_26428/g.31182 Transcript_26428/m.31182 type:complete len:91 (-) Transcript_26428:306-578(-)
MRTVIWGSGLLDVSAYTLTDTLLILFQCGLYDDSALLPENENENDCAIESNVFNAYIFYIFVNHVHHHIACASKMALRGVHILIFKYCNM